MNNRRKSFVVQFWKIQLGLEPNCQTVNAQPRTWNVSSGQHIATGGV